MFVLCIEVSDLFLYNLEIYPVVERQPAASMRGCRTISYVCESTHERDSNVKCVYLAVSNSPTCCCQPYSVSLIRLLMNGNRKHAKRKKDYFISTYKLKN